MEYSEATRPGFEPLSTYTGMDGDLGPLWPVEHRYETAWPDDDGSAPRHPRWMVRSPWPGLTVRQVAEALLNEDLPGDYNSMYNPPVRDPIIAGFFQLDEAQVAALYELVHAADDTDDNIHDEDNPDGARFMTRHPWLLPCGVIAAIGIVLLVQGSTLERVCGALAVLASLMFALAGELGLRRTRR